MEASSFRQTFIVFHIHWSRLADVTAWASPTAITGITKQTDYFQFFCLAFSCPMQKWYRILHAHHLAVRHKGLPRSFNTVLCRQSSCQRFSGQRGKAAPSPRCFAHRWLSKALSSRSLLHSITGYHHLDLLQTRVWWFLEGDCRLRG